MLVSVVALGQATQKKINIVCAGNSLTSAVGTNTASLPYPAQLQRLLGPNFLVTNSGVAGQTTQNISTNYATQIGNYYNASTYADNILIVWEVRNDLVVNNASSTVVTTTQAYNNFVTLCNTADAQGWKIIVVTVLPSWAAQYKGNSTSTGYNNIDSDRLTVNASIVSNWASFSNALVDIGSNSNLGTLGQNAQAGYVYSSGTRPTKNTWYDDGTHLLNTGYGVIADKVSQAILKLL